MVSLCSGKKLQQIFKILIQLCQTSRLKGVQGASRFPATRRGGVGSDTRLSDSWNCHKRSEPCAVETAERVENTPVATW